ncbi:MAG: Fe-S cluster assembly protein SufD, partial [Planctomycetota bacterium]|nr:Fe-S cluster assembly protein SufD [Planctomycetota bacterium]
MTTVTATSTARPAIATGFDEAALVSNPTRGTEPAWLGELRQTAFAAYQKLLKTPLDPEEWKRVDLRAFQPAKFKIAAASSTPAQFKTLLESRAQFAGVVSHVDGHRIESRLAPELAAKGVLFGGIGELLAQHGELLKSKLLSAVKPDADRIAAWHAAFMTGGTVL